MDFLTSWFQIGAIPANQLHGYYLPGLVVLSYIVAVLASYVALSLVARLREEQSTKAAIYWLIGGAFAMGSGIWSMHFIGMLAFVLPMPMEYEVTWTLSSLLMAMIASGFALFLLQSKYANSSTHLVLGGFIIGLAISSMHYMGMQGMKSHVNIHYLPIPFFLSIFIGIAAAEGALWLALKTHKSSPKRRPLIKIGSALIMGFAISGMHYTGMTASIFTLIPSHSMMGGNAIDPNYLAFFIAVIIAFIFSLALTVSGYYKKMGDAVQNEKNFLNIMLDNLEDGIIACNEEGQVTVLNKTMQKYIKIEIGEKIDLEQLHQHYLLYNYDNSLVVKENYPLKRVLNNETIRGLPLLIKFERETIDVIIDGQPIINREGKNLGAVIVIHNITELKRTEKLKNDFISIVSHELRTPLTSIGASLSLLVGGVMGTFTPKVKELLEVAYNNCNRLLLLINDLLDIEKIHAGKMQFSYQPTNIKQIIQNAVEDNRIYAQKYSVILKIIQPEENLMVRVDSRRLMQVLDNLLSNACKFSPKNETVIIEERKIGNKVRVSVFNKGPGIPTEFQNKIFEKFSQANISDEPSKSGTGLGLNISKNIIEKMGGILNFTSNSQGTNFYFELSLL